MVCFLQSGWPLKKLKYLHYQNLRIWILLHERMYKMTKVLNKTSWKCFKSFPIVPETILIYNSGPQLKRSSHMAKLWFNTFSSGEYLHRVYLQDAKVLNKNFARGPFIYYVSTCRGGGGSENANFCLFLVLKTCWRRGGGGSKNPKNVMT